jgi:hypothetical protein
VARTKEIQCLLGDIDSSSQIELIRGKNSSRGIPDWRCTKSKCPNGRDNSKAGIDPECGLKVKLGRLGRLYGVCRCPVQVIGEKHA